MTNSAAKLALALVALAVAAAPLPARAAVGNDAPAWLRQAASAAPPAYEKDVPAVVLVDEARMVVDKDGKATTTRHYAVRLLTRDGRSAARAAAYYVQKNGKVRDMRAWLVRPGGDAKAYGKDDIVDTTASLEDVYNEGRVAVVSASDEADAGMVFGAEWTVEERQFVSEDIWPFQGRLPVLVSRYTLELPEGWQAAGRVLNHDAVEPTVAGSSYTWELRGLAPIPPEPAGPAVTNVAPRLAVSYGAPGSVRGPASFASWTDVSRWVTDLAAPQSAPSEPLAAKARELVGSAQTELERIRAIARYVQGVNYISIQTNLARGGGYRPRAAADVFAKSYGDCKDKANLMLSMLKTVGIESYLVAIYSGDPTYVREEFASPSQFNHCIIAVKVTGDAAKAPTAIDHPSLGKLLVFDPTDTDTPLGDLPHHEQGSFALLVAGENGGIVRMPEMAPEANKLERRTEVTLGPDGSIAGRISERSGGQAAVAERRLFTGLSRADYESRISRWIAASVSGARVSKIAPTDDRPSNAFALDVEFASDRYAQLMQGRLLVFKPALVNRLEDLSLADSSRSQPVVLDAEAFTETAVIALPAGFTVDETPDAVALETPYGAFRTSYEVKEGKLHFTRTLVVKRATVPVADYAKVRAFYAKVREADQAPVVLIRE